MIPLKVGDYRFTLDAVVWTITAIVCVLRSWGSYRQADLERAEELRQPQPSRTRLLLARMGLRREITRVIMAVSFACIGLLSFAHPPEQEQEPMNWFGAVFEISLFGALFRLWWTIEMDKRDDDQLTQWYKQDNGRNRRSSDRTFLDEGEDEHDQS